MKLNDIITADPDILHGTPVFKGTRVPVQSLFWHLEQGISIDEFLDDFPTVSRQQAIQVLQLSAEILSAPRFNDLYEAVAG